MNNNDIYKLKYIKYKTKYLNLLNQNGGACEPSDEKWLCDFKTKIDLISDVGGLTGGTESCDILFNKINELNEIEKTHVKHLTWKVAHDYFLKAKKRIIDKQNEYGCNDTFRKLFKK